LVSSLQRGARSAPAAGNSVLRFRFDRAAGVSQVEADGSTLRCLVCGSFQPFLEALQGHEVIGIDATLAVAQDAPSVLPTALP